MSEDTGHSDDSSVYMPSPVTSSSVVSTGVSSQPLSSSQGQSHYSDDKGSSEEEKNECPLCLKTFTTSHGLRRHQIVHIQEGKTGLFLSTFC